MEICVVVSKPTADEILAFNIITQYEARSGTAGENFIIVRSSYCIMTFYYRTWRLRIWKPRGQFFFLARRAVRRSCFQLIIAEDDIREDDEFLFLDLSLDTRFSQERTTITLNSTRVTILDNTGK